MKRIWLIGIYILLSVVQSIAWDSPFWRPCMSPNANYTITGTWTNATLVTPALGTPSTCVLTNCTGTAASLTAGNATTCGTASALSAQYIDWNTSSGPTSIKNKPAVTPTGEYIQTQTFSTGDLTYTSHADTTYIEFEMVGGGASSGSCVGASSNVCVSSGGGAGEYGRLNTSNVLASTAYSITVGAGGAAITGDGNGSDGGDTSITIGVATYIAKGGVKGEYIASGSTPAFISGGAGGAAGTGTLDVRIPGSVGLSAVRLSGTVAVPGIGGSSTLGAGGNISAIGYDGTNGVGCGSGGGGVSNIGVCTDGICTGGAGSDGCLIIREYK